jgi:putative addiction module component (TIGR02574 family)
MTEIKDILKLSINDRIHLVQTIWDSISEDTENMSISEQHKEILDERLIAHENNPSDVISWDELKTNISKIL